MRLVVACLLAAAFMTGTARTQPTGGPCGVCASSSMRPLPQRSRTSTYTPTALQPNNCGTPDAPKTCPGKKSMSKHHTTHKTSSKQ
jgi:hypothetical protein